MSEPTDSGSYPPWLPALHPLSEAGGDWAAYLESVHAVFQRDFVASQPRFQGKWVRYRRDPIYDGKEAGFWHCISEGASEEERIPDLRRCERMAWIRAVIENGTESDVDVWENERHGNRGTLLWFREEYLIVLGNRIRSRDGFEYYQLVTAYCTPEEHRKRKLRVERDAYRGE